MSGCARPEAGGVQCKQSGPRQQCGLRQLTCGPGASLSAPLPGPRSCPWPPCLALAAVTGPPWPPALHWPSLPLSLHWLRRCAAVPRLELTNRLAGQQTLGPVSRAQQRAAPYIYCACAASGACAVRAVRGSHCRRNLLLGGVSQRVEGPYIQWGRTETAHWTE